MERAKTAGATIIKSAQETFYGGYAGYFQDPDQQVFPESYMCEPIREIPPSKSFQFLPKPGRTGSVLREEQEVVSVFRVEKLD